MPLAIKQGFVISRCILFALQSPNLGQAFFGLLQTLTPPISYSQLLHTFILLARPVKAFQFAIFVLKACFRFGYP